MRFNTALIPSQRYEPPGGQWWLSGIVYQVYPRSFQDSDSDGVGDLRGVRSRLDYLQRLGVDAIWLSPVYASPQEDNGYDISDYRAIDPLFGTMEDFIALLDDVHARGMRLIMDLVVNHTSTQHEWFRESRSPSSPKRDWYYWRPARPGHSPGAPGSEPNNWESFFSGPAWCFDEESGEYYLHLFAPGQADLNWENPQVRRAVYDMMNWWLDLGIDGFRVDAIDVIAKEEGLPDGGPARPPFGVGYECFAGRPRLHDFLQEMHREVFAGRPAVFTVGETSSASPDSALLFCDPARREFNSLIQFEHVNLGTEAGKFSPRALRDGELVDSLCRWQDGVGERGWNCLYLDSHDQPRSASRFGDPEHWRASATALATMLQLQRGTPFVYQGQELGMTNAGFTSIDQYRDVESLNYYAQALAAGTDERTVLSGLARMSRDNARTPMQWGTSSNAGFTTGTPWIGLSRSWASGEARATAEAQVDDPDSIYSYYRALAELRHRLPVVALGSFNRTATGDARVFAYERRLEGESALVVVVNLSSQTIAPRPGVVPAAAPLVLSNGDGEGPLGPWEARVHLLTD